MIGLENNRTNNRNYESSGRTFFFQGGGRWAIFWGMNFFLTVRLCVIIVSGQ